jgi:hypothetical protein
MTKREVAELMTILQANYPDSFKGQSDEVVAAKVALWHDFFKDYPSTVVSAAAKAFMATDAKGFMPNVGQITEQIRRLNEPEEMTAIEAWGYVSKALRNSAYGSVEEFTKLPPLIQKVVGSPEQLKEWALMETDVVQSVISSNFQRSFKVGQDRERDFEKLPCEVKAFIGQIAGTAIGRLESGDKEE